jgi:hypothetical protein
MRFWWRDRSERDERGDARVAVASRPRVAHAVRAARAAGLGSAAVDPAALRHFEAIERAAASGPLHKARRRAGRGLSPVLLWETAKAARETGRRPEEVWAEALSEWLTAQELVADASPFAPLVLGVRREEGWHEIESAMRALRAS